MAPDVQPAGPRPGDRSTRHIQPLAEDVARRPEMRPPWGQLLGDHLQLPLQMHFEVPDLGTRGKTSIVEAPRPSARHPANAAAARTGIAP